MVEQMIRVGKLRVRTFVETPDCMTVEEAYAFAAKRDKLKEFEYDEQHWEKLHVSTKLVRHVRYEFPSPLAITAKLHAAFWPGQRSRFISLVILSYLIGWLLASNNPVRALLVRPLVAIDSVFGSILKVCFTDP